MKKDRGGQGVGRGGSGDGGLREAVVGEGEICNRKIIGKKKGR